MKDLYLVRGVPGSGKSTFVRNMAAAIPGAKVFESDRYFEENGTYIKCERVGKGRHHFDAYEWCVRNVNEAMKSGEEKIFVANPFLLEIDMKIYNEIAKKFNYRVTSIVIENRHGGTNVHEVSEERVNEMRESFEIKI